MAVFKAGFVLADSLGGAIDLYSMIIRVVGPMVLKKPPFQDDDRQ